MNLVSLLLLLNTSGSCYPVAGDRILSDDLVRAIPALHGLPLGVPIGYSPGPGVRRILRESELLRIAHTHGVEATHLQPVCFVLPMASVSEISAVLAMKESLGAADAKVRVRELQPRLAPQGRVVFPRSALLAPAVEGKDRPAIWRGYVEYAAGRKVPLTAKVDISVPGTRVVANRLLTPGSVITADAVRLETADEFPTSTEPLRSIEQLKTRTPRHIIQPGQAIWPNDLVAVPAILKGDRVQVEVRNGAAHLSLEGEAESAGYPGQTIQIRNLSTGKRFPAKVESARLVVVALKGGAR